MDNERHWFLGKQSYSNWNTKQVHESGLIMRAKENVQYEKAILPFKMLLDFLSQKPTHPS